MFPRDMSPADIIQEYPPKDQGSRARGENPLGVISIKEAEERGELCYVGISRGLGGATLLNLVVNQFYPGLSWGLTFALVEACFMASISIRSRNDSRLYGLKEASGCLLLLSLAWALIAFCIDPETWQLVREVRNNVGHESNVALLRLVGHGAPAIAVIAAVVVGFFSMQNDKPYENSENQLGYVYCEEMQQPYVRSADGFFFGLFWVLPFILPRGDSLLSLALCGLLVFVVGVRYAYIVAAESLDFFAAKGTNQACIDWFDPANANRHFLFLDVFRDMPARILAPDMGAWWKRARQIQCLFAGYNHGQFRATGKYDLSPSLENPMVRLGLLNLFVAVFSLFTLQFLAYGFALLDPLLLIPQVVFFPRLAAYIVLGIFGLCGGFRLVSTYFFAAVCPDEVLDYFTAFEKEEEVRL